MSAFLSKYNGSLSASAQIVASPVGVRSRDGEVWNVSYLINYNLYIANRFQRWDSSNIYNHIPNGLFLDEIKENVIYPEYAGATTTGCGHMQVDLTFRESDNMSDSSPGGSPTIPIKYECFNKTYQIPLHQLERYPSMASYVGASSATSKLFEYAYNWKMATTIADRQEAWNRANTEITDASQRSQIVDYFVKTSKGVDIVERNVPILRRTQIVNTAPTITDTGYIGTIPAGFGALIPSGYEWRKITHSAAREGRVGPHYLVEEWEGSPADTGGWDNDLYGTYNERTTNYRTFAAP